eukprot:jgi/Botrbrau1/11777/Bobra.0195s0101.1
MCYTVRLPCALPGSMYWVQTEYAGRGIIAQQDFSSGERIYQEEPLICVPSLDALGKVCSHCLQVHDVRKWNPGNGILNGPLCSSKCSTAASNQYLQVYKAADFRALEAHCEESRERFPLLAMRAACMHLSLALSLHTGHEGCEGGEVIRGLDLLSYAKVGGSAPEPWVDAFQLFVNGLQPFISSLPQQDLEKIDPVVKQLSLSWWNSLLARIHINSFRVDAVFPVNADKSSSLQAAAAAAVLGDAGDAKSGTAVYLLASFFNHSCTPNLACTFPGNNGVAVFTAARDIQQGEELTITYINNELPVGLRQEQLWWAYGFRCSCPLCCEELWGAPQDK